MWLRKSPTILPPLTWTISSLPAGASARQIINHQQTATKLKLPWTILLLRWTPLLLTMILQGKQIVDILITLTAADLSPACLASDVADLNSKKDAAKTNADSAVVALTSELEALNEKITASGGTPAVETPASEE